MLMYNREVVIRAARLRSRCLVENGILVVVAQTSEDEAPLPDSHPAFIRAAVEVVVVLAAVVVVLALVQALAQLVARVAVAGVSRTLTGPSLQGAPLHVDFLISRLIRKGCGQCVISAGRCGPCFEFHSFGWVTARAFSL